MLSVLHLTKAYKTVLAVRDVSFEIKGGEIVGLLGPNGAGKTTVLRCVAGIIRPAHGRIVVDGHDLHRSEIMAKKALAFVPETPEPYDLLTVSEHLKFIALAYGAAHDLDVRRESLLKRFELYEKRNSLVSSLSKGMKQKLAIACAFMHDARVLLFDEPLVGLDPKGARELKNMILEAREMGRAILISTHMLDTAERFCDRILILDRGQKVAEGTLTDLLACAEAVGDASLEDVFLTLTHEARNEATSLPEPEATP